jgi:uncharacterized protein (DUF2147 family)
MNTMNDVSRLIAASCLFLTAGAAMAANDTPVGTWKQIDGTGKTRSIIEIADTNGELKATIKAVLNRSPRGIARDGNPPLCTQCSGDFKDKPIVGMVNMWGVRKDGDVWDGGRILNPADGKTYKVRLSVMDNGQKLEVRGYIGVPMMGQSQIWERQE